MVETVVTVEHTTSTTTTAEPVGDGLRAIRLNKEYFQTLPGILKIVQFVIGLLCMLFGSPVYYAGSSFFMVVVLLAWIVTLLWITAYFLGLRQVIPIAINWVLTELINTGIITLLYFIGDILQFVSLTGPYASAGYILAAILGIFNVLAYGAGTYYLFLAHKNGATY